MKTILLYLTFLINVTLSAQEISIFSFSPTSGPIGTTVTISGEGFSIVPEHNNVTFNTAEASVISSTSTSITVTVPTGATTGPVYVSISENEGISSSVFTVTDSTFCNTISKNNAKHWYFGNQAALKFENNIPIALTNSAMTQVEGVATMSDSNGNLLFYTNGITVYNRNHEVMQNGTGLLSNSSNTQAAFIVPNPNDINKYYIITPNQYYYSTVDMTLDNGNGAIIENEKNILISSESSEKIAGVLSSNERDIWLITYGANQKKFNVYKIDQEGIATTPVSSTFDVPSGFFGYMKISPDGTKIAMANFNQSFHLYDFNRVTGEVSNQVVVSFTSSIGGFGSYGIEFSPNNDLLYVADHRGQNRVFQFDLTQPTPELIAGSVVPLEANTVALGALQLGLDNKIYLARENNGFLGVINSPNNLGESCNFVAEGFDLEGKTSNLGLPGFVASSLVNDSPYISSFSPEGGQIGQAVSINGIGFSTIQENNLVRFNGVQAEVTQATETQLTVIVPSTATSGPISLEIGCNFVATTDDFIIQTMGMNEFSSSTIRIYPNPTSEKVYFSKEISQVSLYDSLGKLVPILFSTNSLDVSHLPFGVYFLNGFDKENKPFKFKLVKK